VFELTSATIKKARAWRESTGVRVPILIVLDSMKAAISKMEHEGDWDDQHISAQARVYSKSLPKLIPEVSKEDVALLWISQIRDKIGVMFGSKDDICGGHAPKFYASLVMDVKKVGMNKKEGEDATSNRTEVYVRKNQIAPPFRTAAFDIVYGHGIDREGDILDIACDAGLVEKSGTWFSYDGERIAQGRLQSIARMRKDAVLREAMLRAVMKV